MNVLRRSKREAILHLGRQGWSLRRIQRELGIRRETVSKYLRAAGVAVRRPGAGGAPGAKPIPPAPSPKSGQGVTPDPKPGQGVIPDPESVQGVSPDLRTGQGVTPDPTRSPSLCEPFRELFVRDLARGRDAKAIWRDLVDDHGFAGSYQSAKRFARRLRGTRAPELSPVIITPPGEEAQVDYGLGPLLPKPGSKRRARPRLFVLTLGYSRKSVALLSWKSSAEIWAELHEKAFRELGGAPQVLVLDNLREGVLKSDIYDPELNPLYRDVLAHYGCQALPCRVRDPDRKGKVEASVKFAQRALAGKDFQSLEEAQSYLDRWQARWADTRIHGRTKRQVAEMFAEERPHLKPLPLERFRFYRFGVRRVHRDGCVEVEAAYYSAPPGRVGSEVQVQWDGAVVRLLDSVTGQLLCEHRRHRRGRHRYQPGHEPKRTAPQLQVLLERSRRAGAHTGAVAEAIFTRHGAAGVRKIQGLLSLAKKYSPARLEDACRFAVETGVTTYQMVKRYLARPDSPANQLDRAHSLLRELGQYRELFEAVARSQEKGPQ